MNGNGIEYHLEVLAPTADLEQIAKLLTVPVDWSQPYERDTQKNRHNHFHKFSFFSCNRLGETSEQFPSATFLLEELDGQYCWSRRKVVRAGDVIRSSFDDRPDQLADWIPIDIFTPFIFEFYNELPFGSMWERFLSEAEAQIKLQRESMEEEKQNK